MTIKKNTRVLVHSGSDAGVEGTLRGYVWRRISSTSRGKMAQLIDCRLGDDPEPNTEVPAEDLTAYADVPPGPRTELVRAQQAKRQAAELQMKKDAAAWRAKKVVEYVAERVADVGQLASFEYVSSDGTSSELRVDPFSSDGEYRREFICARAQAANGSFYQLPSVTVNWSGIGSVSPEVALQFAESLQFAARQALIWRERLERAEPDVWEALTAEPARPLGTPSETPPPAS